ncbi:MAG: hypothetical protein HC913_10305 [Microscillaceae bacterium]|nr:hypothetical protein [Microscillaceae bacterium]
MSINKLIKSMITLGVLFVPGYWAYKWFFDPTSEKPAPEVDKLEASDISGLMKTPKAPSASQVPVSSPSDSTTTSELNPVKEETPETAPATPPQNEGITSLETSSITAPSLEPLAEEEMEYYNGKPVFVGAKGGKYYLSDTGRKIYIREED